MVPVIGSSGQIIKERGAAMDEDKRYEKLGRAAAGFAWFVFAAKFLAVTTIIALVILYLIGRPLWIAPIAAVIVFSLYRLVWRLLWKIIEWAAKQ